MRPLASPLGHQLSKNRGHTVVSFYGTWTPCMKSWLLALLMFLRQHLLHFSVPENANYNTYLTEDVYKSVTDHVILSFCNNSLVIYDILS